MQPTGPEHWLESDVAPATREWIIRQVQVSSNSLSRFGQYEVLRKKITTLLTSPSLELPFSAGRTRAFNLRAAEESLSSVYCTKGGAISRISAPQRFEASWLAPEVHSLATDGDRLAIALRRDGLDEVRLQIIDIDSNRPLTDYLPPFETARTALDRNLQGYFFVEPDDIGFRVMYQSLAQPRPVAIRRHLVADEPAAINIGCFSDCNWLVLSVRKRRDRHSYDYIVISREPNGTEWMIWADWPHRATFTAKDNWLFVLTDWDAPNQRVIALNLNGDHLGEFSTIVAESQHPIKSIALTSDLLLLVYGASPWDTELRAYTLTGEPVLIEGVPRRGTIEAMRAQPSDSCAHFQWSDIAVAPTIYRIDTKTRRAAIHFRPYSRARVPEIETITTWYSSFDGTRVPIRISRPKDAQCLDCKPVMLTAYGGFGVIDTLRHTNRSTLWLSMGGTYIHAGIRGGGELGQDWHRAGMLDRKENSFGDFIAASEWLIANGFATPQQLAIVGGSNAGLLVGVALTRRPDLFGAVICSGPLLDMLRYHLFAGGNIGLPEFGSPDNPGDAAILLRYSPYHNVRDGVHYPPCLFISGETDTRCDPMHVRKMVARLQSASPSGGPFLLDYRPNKGHAGLMPLADRVDALTNQFSFLLLALGLRLDSSHRMELDPTSPGRRPVSAAQK